MNLVLVGIGGAFGGICRYQLGKVISQRSGTAFPAGTLIINVTGAVLLGVLTGMGVKNSAYALLGDGFLGAYTTFSTFMYEGFHLAEGNQKKGALAYISGTLLLGVFGYALGFAAGRMLAAG